MANRRRQNASKAFAETVVVGSAHELELREAKEAVAMWRSLCYFALAVMLVALIKLRAGHGVELA